MKKRTYNTTEFYEKPSEALSFVKDGGIVYLGYKKNKEPIAVLTSLKDYTVKKKQVTKSIQKRPSFIERFGKYSMSAPTYRDSVGFIRRQREQI
jgi:hypothetical protein